MELHQDVITINSFTNTVTLNTESYDRLTKYLMSLMVNGQEHEVTSYRCALRYKPKTPLPKVDNNTPPSPKPKPPLPTKKQGPPPKKQEDWPSLSAASSSNKSKPSSGRLALGSFPQLT
ncbi:hypothetical protein MRX96_045014 [Rhipicephalus microplus]